MQHKTPNRKQNDITQTYNSGVVTIYAIADTALPGHKPQPTPSLKGKLRYEELRLGISRFYASRQAQTEVSRVIRVPRSGMRIDCRDIAETEDGERYEIDLVQLAPDVWPPSVDLTLIRREQREEAGV